MWVCLPFWLCLDERKVVFHFHITYLPATLRLSSYHPTSCEFNKYSEDIYHRVSVMVCVNSEVWAATILLAAAPSRKHIAEDPVV